MITICWWDASGDEQRIPVAQLAYVPAVGAYVDLEDVDDELLEQHIREDERIDLAHLQVVEVVHKLTGVDVWVERDPETTHKRELEAKDETIAHVQRTGQHLLSLLQIVVADGVFFAFDGGGDQRDIVAVHLAEGTPLSSELSDAVDAIFIYPTYAAAKLRSASRRCVKHRYPELVTKTEA